MISNFSVIMWTAGIVLVLLFVFFPDTANGMLDAVLGRDVEMPSLPDPIINTIEPYIPDNDDDDQQTLTLGDEISLANWNLQIFGISKAADQDLMTDYASIINDYDIVFVQEIRDISETAFPQLCSLLNGYNCEVSSRAGRSSSKEQYGIIYKDSIDLVSVVDYNPDSEDRWERPPVKATFNVEGYTLTVYNIHAKPDDVQMELRALQNIVTNNGNQVLIGDLNADCSYYDSYYGTEFDSWNWVITDNEDTTVSSTDCAYDRIIMNDDAFEEYSLSGVRTLDITAEHSDHYLVWANIKITEVN